MIENSCACDPILRILFPVEFIKLNCQFFHLGEPSSSCLGLSLWVKELHLLARWHLNLQPFDCKKISSHFYLIWKFYFQVFRQSKFPRLRNRSVHSKDYGGSYLLQNQTCRWRRNSGANRWKSSRSVWSTSNLQSTLHSNKIIASLGKNIQIVLIYFDFIFWYISGALTRSNVFLQAPWALHLEQGDYMRSQYSRRSTLGRPLWRGDSHQSHSRDHLQTYLYEGESLFILASLHEAFFCQIYNLGWCTTFIENAVWVVSIKTSGLSWHVCNDACCERCW